MKNLQAFLKIAIMGNVRFNETPLGEVITKKGKRTFLADKIGCIYHGTELNAYIPPTGFIKVVYIFWGILNNIRKDLRCNYLKGAKGIIICLDIRRGKINVEEIVSEAIKCTNEKLVIVVLYYESQEDYLEEITEKVNKLQQRTEGKIEHILKYPQA